VGAYAGHAYRLVDAAQLYSQLSPMGDIPLPENERQIRPICGLPISSAAQIWKRAVERAAGSHVTGKLVQQARDDVSDGEKQSCRVCHPRESWQIQVEPLLERALVDKAAVQDLVFRMSLLLSVGETLLKGVES
jgi:hypothetical protein